MPSVDLGAGDEVLQIAVVLDWGSGEDRGSWQWFGGSTRDYGA